MKNEKFVIVSIKNVFAGQTMTTSPIRFVIDRGDLIDMGATPAQATSFNLEDARARVEELDEEDYICSNSEAGRPEYLIVSEDDAEGIFSAGADNNYPWEDCRCEDGEDGTPCGQCEQCFEFTADIDCDRLREVAK